MNKPYVKPSVKTVEASQIIDSMGPVSCGSGAGQTTNPVSSDPMRSEPMGGQYRKLS